MGFAAGLAGLGLLAHEDGEDALARELYGQAAELGSTTAMVNLGLMANADGDVVSAEEWWQKAAALGDMTALFQLGRLEQRDEIAAGQQELLKRAESGEADAMFEFALGAYSLGDFAVALMWFEQAGDALEEQGDVPVAGIAWTNAAECARAVGDRTSQRRCLERGSELGNDDAVEMLAEIVEADIDSDARSQGE